MKRPALPDITLTDDERFEIRDIRWQLYAAEAKASAAIEEYNRIQDKARDAVEAISERLADDFNSQPEAWRSSDDADKAYAMVEAWDTVDFLHVAEIERFDFDTIGQLPDTVTAGKIETVTDRHTNTPARVLRRQAKMMAARRLN